MSSEEQEQPNQTLNAPSKQRDLLLSQQPLPPPSIPSNTTKPARPLSIIGGIGGGGSNGPLSSGGVSYASNPSPVSGGNNLNHIPTTATATTAAATTFPGTGEVVKDAQQTLIAAPPDSGETNSSQDKVKQPNVRKKVMSFLRTGSFSGPRPVEGGTSTPDILAASGGPAPTAVESSSSPRGKRTSFALFKKDSKTSLVIGGPVLQSAPNNAMFNSASSINLLGNNGNMSASNNALKVSTTPASSNQPSQLGAMSPILSAAPGEDPPKPSFEDKMKRKVRQLEAQLRSLQDTVNKLLSDNSELHKRLDVLSPPPPPPSQNVDVASIPGEVAAAVVLLPELSQGNEVMPSEEPEKTDALAM